MGQNGVQMPYLSAGFDGTLKCKLKIIKENREIVVFPQRIITGQCSSASLLGRYFNQSCGHHRKVNRHFDCRFTFEQVLTELDSLCDQ